MSPSARRVLHGSFLATTSTFPHPTPPFTPPNTPATHLKHHFLTPYLSSSSSRLFLFLFHSGLSSLVMPSIYQPSVQSFLKSFTRPYSDVLPPSRHLLHLTLNASAFSFCSLRPPVRPSISHSFVLSIHFPSPILALMSYFHTSAVTQYVSSFSWLPTPHHRFQHPTSISFIHPCSATTHSTPNP